MASDAQGNPQAYSMPPASYPPPGQAYSQAPYAAPPPVGYPTNNIAAAQQVPVETKSRDDDGFWKGCCAALCCCCVLDTCF